MKTKKQKHILGRKEKRPKRVDRYFNDENVAIFALGTRFLHCYLKFFN